MKNNYILALLIGLLFSACGKDTVTPDQKDEFVKYYGLALNDEGKKIIQNEGGGYTVLATVQTPDLARQIALIKTDEYGNLGAAPMYFGAEFNDEAYDLVPDGQGGYYILGSTQRSRQGNLDLILMHVDATGSILWEAKHGSARDEIAVDMLLNEQGELIVAGYSDSLAQEGNRLLIASFDALSGNQNWLRLHGINGSDFKAFAVEQASNGYVLAGTAENERKDPNSYCAIYMKTSLYGEFPNFRYVITDHNAEFNSICRTATDNYVLCGTNNSDDELGGEIIIKQIDGGLNEISGNTISLDSPVITTDAQIINDQVFISGTSSESASTVKAALIETSISGDLRDIRLFGEKTRTGFNSFVFSNADEIVLVGINQIGENVSTVYLHKTHL